MSFHFSDGRSDFVGGGNSGDASYSAYPTLTTDERNFLSAVERGDLSTVKTYLDEAAAAKVSKKIIPFNANCVDALGRSALLIAIEIEHSELLALLLTHKLELGDSLLHAISEENVEAVEMILQALMCQLKDQKEWEPGHASPSEAFEEYRRLKSDTLQDSSSVFTADITPIILAAHRDNYEIIKILLDRGDRIPKPHDLQCSCIDCADAHKTDSLSHSKSRINAFRALASPCLIALSSKDPVLTAFELSWVLRRLGSLENEFKGDYEELAKKCQNFAVALLEQTRSSDELGIILNHTNGYESFRRMNPRNIESRVEANCLARLKLAIKYKQKDFVAHPHCQQLLASLWYEGLPGFRRRPFLFKAAMIFGISLLFPLLSIFYLIAPHSRLGRIMKKPFIKFLCHSASYMVFLVLLILAALNINIGWGSLERDEKGALPTLVEVIIVVYVAGFIWAEVKELWSDGVTAYVTDMWNLLDFATNALYVATITLRVVAYYLANKYPQMKTIKRSEWNSYDPTLISECLFAAANIFSTLKLVFIFTVNPHLGPLQISLGRMLNDILKFFCVYILVLMAFACGLNQLLWFYAKKRRIHCQEKRHEMYNPAAYGNTSELYNFCTTKGKYFTGLFEIVQSLYWSTYGLIDLNNLNLEYPHDFTEFISKLMFGAYSCICFVVLLNMLIAMMNNSYLLIAESADAEWKFARSKLWVSYFADGDTLPVPFNILPSPKSFRYIVQWVKTSCCICKTKTKKSRWQSIRKIVARVNEMEERYQKVMNNLIKRYLMKRQKGNENQGVTEDDMNEIKGDISAFRYELLDILQLNGMRVPPRKETTTRSGGAKSRNRKAMNRLSRHLDASMSIQYTSSEGNLFSSTSTTSSNHTLLNQVLSLNTTPDKRFQKQLSPLWKDVLGRIDESPGGNPQTPPSSKSLSSLKESTILSTLFGGRKVTNSSSDISASEPLTGDLLSQTKSTTTLLLGDDDVPSSPSKNIPTSDSYNRGISNRFSSHPKPLLKQAATCSSSLDGSNSFPVQSKRVAFSQSTDDAESNTDADQLLGGEEDALQRDFMDSDKRSDFV